MDIDRNFFARAGFVAAALTCLSTPVFATTTVTVFTDQVLFEAALTTSVTEDFNGAASDFAENSSGNSIGTQTTVDLIGGVGDPGPTGLIGNGFFQGEVDALGDDPLSLNFNTGHVFGFGLVGLQNDSNSDPGGLDLEEIGIEFAGYSFLVSDLLGLTNSSDGQRVQNVDSTGPVFIGLLADVAQTGFSLVHGDDAAPGAVVGNTEEFFVDALVLATAPGVAAVPLPAGLPFLLAGLGGFAALRRVKTKAAGL